MHTISENVERSSLVNWSIVSNNVKEKNSINKILEKQTVKTAAQSSK